MGEGETCGQWVTGSEGCCDSEYAVCGAAAAWRHAEGGVALCAEHHANAERYGGRELGRWTVGDVTVAYPAGWARVAVDTAGAGVPAIEVVTEVGGGLIV